MSGHVKKREKPGSVKARKGGRMEVRSIVYRVHGVIGFMELIEFIELTLKTL